MTTPTDRVRAALEDIVHAAFEHGNKCLSGKTLDPDGELLGAAKEALRELDGKVLVPVEPIGPMIMYGIHAHEKNDDLPDIGLGPKCVGIYRAMIAPYVEGRRQ